MAIGVTTSGSGGFGDLDWDDTGLPDLTSFSTSSGSSGASVKFQRDKFLTELRLKEAQRQRELAGRTAQAEYIRSQLGAGIPSEISGEIESQQAAGQSYIQDEYSRLLGALGERRQAGQQQMTTGYDALRSFLEANPAQAYASAQRVMPTETQNALQQYMQSRGVSTAPVQREVEMLNQQLAGGASNYNQLLNVLSASEQQQQQSRLAEEQMARQFGLGGLERQYATATTGLESSRLSALNELASRVSAARLQAQREASSRDQALRDALATLLGVGVPAETVVPPPEGEAVVPPPVAKPTPTQQLQAKVANATNQTLVNRVNAFVAQRPNATPAQIAKEFPSLGKNITR